MKYHALFVIFEKSGKICNCRLLQIIGGALRVNVFSYYNVTLGAMNVRFGNAKPHKNGRYVLSMH